MGNGRTVKASDFLLLPGIGLRGEVLDRRPPIFKLVARLWDRLGEKSTSNSHSYSLVAAAVPCSNKPGVVVSSAHQARISSQFPTDAELWAVLPICALDLLCSRLDVRCSVDALHPGKYHFFNPPA